jgi:hypothetical protein
MIDRSIAIYQVSCHSAEIYGILYVGDRFSEHMMKAAPVSYPLSGQQSRCCSRVSGQQRAQDHRNTKVRTASLSILTTGE